jgi:hypothetical protein
MGLSNIPKKDTRNLKLFHSYEKEMQVNSFRLTSPFRHRVYFAARRRPSPSSPRLIFSSRRYNLHHQVKTSPRRGANQPVGV